MALFRRGNPKQAVAQMAVIVHYSTTGAGYGTEQEREQLFRLEDRLTAAIEAAGAGELDGNEFGAGEAVIYMYGHDADGLWRAVEPIVRDFPLRPAFVVIERADGRHRIDL